MKDLLYTLIYLCYWSYNNIY